LFICSSYPSTLSPSALLQRVLAFALTGRAHWTRMREWMFVVGHVVEGIIYVADCINVVVGVAKMLKKSFREF
jgi:hypothetical protein